MPLELRLMIKRGQLYEELGESIPGRANKLRSFKVMSLKYLIKKKKSGVYREFNKRQIM